MNEDKREEDIEKIVEQFKAVLSIEELDFLERKYNEALKKAKEASNNSLPSTTKEA